MIRRRLGSHQPPALLLIGLNVISKSISRENSSLASPLSSWRLIGIGASTTGPFSPWRTQRPS
jgi:hypothetical protein